MLYEMRLKSTTFAIRYSLCRCLDGGNWKYLCKREWLRLAMYVHKYVYVYIQLLKSYIRTTYLPSKQANKHESVQLYTYLHYWAITCAIQTIY